MGLFGSKPKFAAHPVFTLTAGMPQATVLERIGPPTERRTSADVITELAGPGGNVDLSRVDPEDYWFYDDVPDGFHLMLLIREQQLVEVTVQKNGSQELVARIDDRGIAASRIYRRGLRARRL
jgi:hypothetical protein